MSLQQKQRVLATRKMNGDLFTAVVLMILSLIGAFTTVLYIGKGVIYLIDQLGL